MAPLAKLVSDETIIALFGEGSSVSSNMRSVIDTLTKQCTEGRDLAKRSAAGAKVQYKATVHRKKLMGGGNAQVNLKMKDTLGHEAEGQASPDHKTRRIASESSRGDGNTSDGSEAMSDI